MQRGKRIAEMIQAFDRPAEEAPLDTRAWYTVNMDAVEEPLRLLYYPSSVDAQTYEFLNESTRLSQSFCLQMFYGMCTIFLQTMATKTTINGILERGRMFVFSSEQLGNLLGRVEGQKENMAVIDLGAGDGHVTRNFRPFFDKIYATEASSVMEYRLRQKDFHVLPKDDWKSKGPFQFISALNLLDRFFDPALLLRDIHEVALRDDALVLLGVVLPISQYVEFHPAGRGKTSADSAIRVQGRTFEEHLNSLVRSVLAPNGFQLLRWTKVPYLCEGDANKAVQVEVNSAQGPSTSRGSQKIGAGDAHQLHEL